MQRSRRLDAGSAIMGFSQITVITLVVVILAFGSVGNQKVLVSIIDEVKFLDGANTAGRCTST